ncbi:Microcystin-dependent protein [Halpernia humi]|uniref:Microcystin-dependent protein n=1 Tax=Halpernia humi TaxID=493375 RepID=A0A1H5Y623_9FLAO|nr:tail fiber protein [Halpernia humi]SEG19378.1 Microcystin-dependent protein [Halpernia humi]
MKKLILLCLFASSFGNIEVKAQATEPFLGQIAFVAFNFAPRGWAECNGAILPISQYSALFALLGTQYGGDGRTTFALPDMRGRVILSNGQGPGLSAYSQGQIGGQESVTLTVNQMPSHSHTVNAVLADGNSSVATGSLPANTKTLDPEYSNSAGDTTMNANMVAPAGGNQAHENRPPYLVLKCIIATQGIFPSRN